MSLASEVALRVPARRLIELTNRDDNTATSANATILAKADADVTSMFPTYSGSTLDLTKNEHVRLGCDGIVALLRDWASGDATFLDKWKEQVREYALTSARDHRSLTTSSPLTPTDEASADGTAVVGWSDPEHFEGYVPSGP